MQLAPLRDDDTAPELPNDVELSFTLLPDLTYRRVALVNVIYLGASGGNWILVDTGLPGSAEAIVRGAEARFGPQARPAAIVLTHGHSDHAGSAGELAGHWDIPIFAHELEMPYVSGRAGYPPADPALAGAPLTAGSGPPPSEPIRLEQWLQPLPEDGSVPGAPGWQWIHTPGHTPGHGVLWRAADRALLAGDAVITTRQETMFSHLLQWPELHGPPALFTQNWEAAENSVVKLASLKPEFLLSAHGRAMRGRPLREQLVRLARDFQEVCVPEPARSSFKVVNSRPLSTE